MVNSVHTRGEYDLVCAFLSLVQSELGHNWSRTPLKAAYFNNQPAFQVGIIAQVSYYWEVKLAICLDGTVMFWQTRSIAAIISEPDGAKQLATKILRLADDAV